MPHATTLNWFSDPDSMLAASCARYIASHRHLEPESHCCVGAMHRVLIVDDDTELSAMLCEYLARENFVVEACDDGFNGARRALSGDFDIAVLDVAMPGRSGLDTLREIRAASQLPVLMLTARGDDIDKVVGLELGADDYVPKPCTPRELMARLRAILRRTGSHDSVSDEATTAEPAPRADSADSLIDPRGECLVAE
jgi:DNA-binding response OmpR family regulator